LDFEQPLLAPAVTWLKPVKPTSQVLRSAVIEAH